MNPWQLYDELIEGISDNITVIKCSAGYNWTTVMTSEGYLGLAMTVPLVSVPPVNTKTLEGMKLKDAARLSKSWNFVEASIGVAAIGAYYNIPKRAQNCGIQHPGIIRGMKPDAFELYQNEIKGKNVAVIGHFPLLEQRFAGICNMTVLERDPQWGDLPDTACEYILPQQDYVFMTGSTLVNKTMPRLLELSAGAKVILVGPSIILSSVLFKYGVYGLSGFLVENISECERVLREGNTMALFNNGIMIDRITERIN